jgi:hypothetical protein
MGPKHTRLGNFLDWVCLGPTEYIRTYSTGTVVPFLSEPEKMDPLYNLVLSEPFDSLIKGDRLDELYTLALSEEMDRDVAKDVAVEGPREEAWRRRVFDVVAVTGSLVEDQAVFVEYAPSKMSWEEAIFWMRAGVEIHGFQVIGYNYTLVHWKPVADSASMWRRQRLAAFPPCVTFP